ncbi:hypothetical protein [Streptomyces diastatochromogenes]|uniref:hypothetical protein n=1 Tax=Streptomyces diastatochromogenes TaxID=42236 RepID=UPI000B916752|nr:hypothetical protein [Streptomyces diastatochromogenes]
MRDAEPAGRDVVRPVLIDSPHRRLLLLPRPVAREVLWTVPTVAIRRGDTCRRAASRYLRHVARLPSALRISPLIGRLPRDASTGVQYLVVVRPAVGGWPANVRTALGLCGRWWTTAELRSAEVTPDPVQLLDFMDGYWDGWLPDGAISLD